jgi:hypothetical protein
VYAKSFGDLVLSCSASNHFLDLIINLNQAMTALRKTYIATFAKGIQRSIVHAKSFSYLGLH